MSASKKPEPKLDYLVIASAEDLDSHDGLSPAYILIPGALVKGLHTFFLALPEENDTGRLCRGVETLLIGLGEPSTLFMVSGLNMAVKSMNALIVTAQEIRDELDAETVEGEEDDGEDESRLN